MKPEYKDILSRIKEVPLWYGTNGVPRFDRFNPKMCSNIYADEVLLLEIQCQDCHEKFHVEMYHSKPSNFQSLEYRVINFRKYSWIPIHYGDPPRHKNCCGETMNAESLRILEFWKREYSEWVRKSNLEISFV